MFEKINTKNIINNDKGDLPATTAILSNNQIGKYISKNGATILKNVFSATANGFGKAFYQPYDFTVFQDSYAFKFKDDNIDIQKIHYFITTSLNKIYSKYNWGNKSGWNKIKEEKIKLPTKDGKIDFNFMKSLISELEEERISELEEERISELSAYLKVSRLDSYELSDEEKQALEDFNNIKWKEYKMGVLFDRIKTKKLGYKAKDLPKEPIRDYVLPALTSSFMNQGLNYYLPKEGATILKNVISIPSNSDVYRAYYQSREFTVLSDAYAIDWNNKRINFEENNYIFVVPCINKVTDLSIYSYKNKLGGWNVVKNKNITLPVNSNDEIDFEYMRIFIQAIKKLVIKDVVIYADEKIKATKKVVRKD